MYVKLLLHQKNSTPYTTQLLGLNCTGFSRPYLRYHFYLFSFPTLTKIFQFSAFPYKRFYPFVCSFEVYIQK